MWRVLLCAVMLAAGAGTCGDEQVKHVELRCTRTWTCEDFVFPPSTMSLCEEDAHDVEAATAAWLCGATVQVLVEKADPCHPLDCRAWCWLTGNECTP